jgi:hypothetical protein
MRAVDGEDLKLPSCDAPYPARGVRGLAIGRHDIGVLKRSQPRFAFREFADSAKWNPGKISVRSTPCNRGEKKSDDRYSQNTGGKTIK